MERGMMDSFKRTFKFIKEHILTILIICVALFCVSMALMLIQQMIRLVINIVIFIVIFLIGMGLALVIEGGSIAVLGIILIIIGCILAMATIIGLIALFVLMGSVGMGAQIFISELLHKLKHEGEITWRGTENHLKNNWRILLSKGAKLFFAYVLVLIPFILIMSILLIGVFGSLVYSINQAPASSPLFIVSLIVMILAGIVFFISLIILLLIIGFVVDSSAVRIAEGKRVGTAFRHGMKDIRQNRRGVWYYILGTFIMTLASIIFFPLAFILQPFMPILTKSFFMINRDMFYD
jgi:hypothetical protein